MRHYAITPGTLTSSKGDEAERLIARCGELARDGVEFLLVREKQLGPWELASFVLSVMAAVEGSPTKVLVAGGPDVAAAAGADGVHLSARPGELTVEQVREQFAEGLVSRSCHSVQEVVTQTADLILFAPVFGKMVDGVEVVAGVGVGELHEVCDAAGGTPVFALGGVTEENADACIAAGASGVAGIRMFFGAAL